MIDIYIIVGILTVLLILYILSKKYRIILRFFSTTAKIVTIIVGLLTLICLPINLFQLSVIGFNYGHSQTNSIILGILTVFGLIIAIIIGILFLMVLIGISIGGDSSFLSIAIPLCLNIYFAGEFVEKNMFNIPFVEFGK